MLEFAQLISNIQYLGTQKIIRAAAANIQYPVQKVLR